MSDWPDLMSRETLAKRLDMRPGYIDQLVKQGILPAPKRLGEAERWLWSEIRARLEDSYGQPVQHSQPVEDPYDAGAVRAAKAATTRQARPQ